MRFRKRGDRF